MTYLYICVYKYVHKCKRIYDICVCIYTNIHIYIYAYIYIYERELDS